MNSFRDGAPCTRRSVEAKQGMSVGEVDVQAVEAGSGDRALQHDEGQKQRRRQSSVGP